MRYFLFCLSSLFPMVLAAQPDAFQIDEASVLRIDRGGPASVAGVGDWWLTNGQLCIAVSGLKHDAGIVAGGGSLVDISLCEQRNDQWLNTNILAGMAKDDALQAESIWAERSADYAAIVVRGEKAGIEQTVTYSLDASSPHLRMSIELRRVGDGPKLGMSALLTLHPSGSLTPFSAGDNGARGFRLHAVDNNSVLDMVGAMTAADTAYFLGNAIESGPISYRMQLRQARWYDRDNREHSLPIFQLAAADYVMQGWMTRPVWLGKGRPGLLTFAQMPLMDLHRGERLRAEFEIEARATTDVAGFDATPSSARRLVGRVAPDAVMAVYDDRGHALTQTTANADGTFNIATKPRREYHFDITLPTGRFLHRRVTAAEAEQLLDFSATPPGALLLPRGEVMQLTVVGVNGTPTPAFRSGRAMLRDGENIDPGSLASNEAVLTGSADDPAQLALAPGQYHVLASRGLNYNVTETRIDIESGQSVPLDIAVPRRHVLQTDTVAADFHVHSSVSFDSTVPRRHQLKRYFAAGGEVLVFTEHNRIGTPTTAPDLPLQIINGVEYTGTARTRRVPNTIGHSNAFPVVFDAIAHRGGIPRVEDSHLRDVMERTRVRWPAALLQLNHPRSPHPNDADLAFFSHLSQGRAFDPALPLNRADNALLLQASETGARDIDFDLIEILNGSEIEVYEKVRRDWLALLSAGYRKVATANSDSHAWKTPLGVPVNRVLVEDNNLPIDELILLNAIREGRMYGTSGPSISVALLDEETTHAPGDTCGCAHALLRVAIAAPDWIDISRLNVYSRSGRVRSLPLEGPGTFTIPVDFAADDFIVVEVSGEPTAIYQALYPGYTPLAFSNPIYIDANADRAWTPGR